MSAKLHGTVVGRGSSQRRVLATLPEEEKMMLNFLATHVCYTQQCFMNPLVRLMNNFIVSFMAYHREEILFHKYFNLFYIIKA